MSSRSLRREFTLTSIRSQPWDKAKMYVPRMLPRPSLSTKSMPPRSAFKNRCFGARVLISDLKWSAVSVVMRPRQTRVGVPPSEAVCSIINLPRNERGILIFHVLLFSKITFKPLAVIGCKRFSAGGSLVNVARQQSYHALDHPRSLPPRSTLLGCTVPSWREHFNGWREEGE